VLDAEVAASVAEGERLIAAPIVGHDAGDGDAEAFVISHGRPEKGHGAVGGFVGLDLGEGDAGMVVNADVDEIPASAAALVRTRPIAGDAVADTLETPELFDVDVNDLAWVLALIAALRFGRLQITYPVQAQAAQDAADGGRRYLDLGRDLLAGVALAAQGLDGGTCGWRGLARQ
jgi:hypothetical protein